MAQQTIVVTFGRNVGNVPLSDERWAAFQATVDASLHEFVESSPGSFMAVNGNVGEGFWNDDEGNRVTEDNCVFVVVFEAPQDEAGAMRQFLQGQWLSCELAHAAFDFGQETVAVTGGPNILVPAHEDAIKVFAREGLDVVEAFLAEQPEEGV